MVVPGPVAAAATVPAMQSTSARSGSTTAVTLASGPVTLILAVPRAVSAIQSRPTWTAMATWLTFVTLRSSTNPSVACCTPLANPVRIRAARFPSTHRCNADLSRRCASANGSFNTDRSVWQTVAIPWHAWCSTDAILASHARGANPVRITTTPFSNIHRVDAKLIVGLSGTNCTLLAQRCIVKTLAVHWHLWFAANVILALQSNLTYPIRVHIATLPFGHGDDTVFLFRRSSTHGPIDAIILIRCAISMAGNLWFRAGFIITH